MSTLWLSGTSVWPKGVCPRTESVTIDHLQNRTAHASSGAATPRTTYTGTLPLPVGLGSDAIPEVKFAEVGLQVTE